MEYYSALKKNEIMPFGATWVDLEITILSEVSQTKTKIAYVWNLKKISTNEVIYKTENNKPTALKNLTVTKGKRERRDK